MSKTSLYCVVGISTEGRASSWLENVPAVQKVLRVVLYTSTLPLAAQLTELKSKQQLQS